jgi:hypothetical protein
MQTLRPNNLAFIDGQNLYYGTAKRKVDPWKIDLLRFRIYLSQKYHVDKAYYFLGYKKESKFEKILFPDRKYKSSLYNKLSNNYFSYLDDRDIKTKNIRFKNIKKEKGALGN